MTTDLNRCRSDDDCSKLTVFAFDVSIGSEGLRSTLLKFVSMSGPAYTTPASLRLISVKTNGPRMKFRQSEHVKQRLAVGFKHT